MERKLLFICCLLAFVFIACERGKTEPQLLIDLYWADKNDEDVEIKDVRIWIFQANGHFIKEYHYTSEQEIALDLQTMDPGDYTLLTATNLLTPFFFDKVTTYKSVVFKINEISASPSHAYFGMTNVRILPDKNSLATTSLRRVLSELKIEIEGAPEGTTLAAFINNVADGIYPTQNDDEGNFGRATSGHKNVVTIPEATTANGTITTETMRLMPTVAEDTRANIGNSHLRFFFTLANGTTFQCDAEAPIMRSSGKYSLKMKYSELKSYMRIDPIKINDWEEGWIVSGEIFNPEK